MEAEVIASSRVKPHWLGSGDKFWYRIELPENKYEFILVDAANGSCQRGLSEDTLTQKVKQLTGETPDLASLTGNDPEWNGPLHNDNLKGTFPTEEMPSPYAATEVSLRFVNKCGCAITVQWIDHSAEPVSYGTINAGDSKLLTTWQGHLWRLSGQGEGPLSKLLYAAPKSEDNDVLVINDELLHDGEGVGRSKHEMTFPHVFIRENSIWATYEDGSEGKVSGDDDSTDVYDKERIYISPDRKHVVVWRYTPEQEHKVYLLESSPTDQLQPKMHTLQYLKPGNQVQIDRPRLFDLVQRKEITTDDSLFRNPYGLTNAGWDKSSKEYRFIFNERGHQHLRVIAMAVDGGVRALVEESSPTFIDYSTKLYRHIMLDTDEMIWASERDGWNHLYLFDLAQGCLKNQITIGEWLVRSVDRIDEEKRQIWFTSYGIVKGQDPYYAQLARVNFDGSGLTVLTDGDGTHTWQWSPDRRFLIDTWARVDCPPQTVLRNGETGAKMLTVEESRLARLVDAQWNAPELLSTTGRDGATMIYGVIIRPADFDAKRKYPILEEMYAARWHGHKLAIKGLSRRVLQESPGCGIS
ncbi:hypothetical protein NQ176_g10352 [Zarea fungicola]|uniref:Uncharacterized protein n=1 Tax=Zarea fungicola TaxID=93591 RepID=A0ACC1MG78_9HYPO|nr:hypothetical protein NQ176_g10352 [Lecanicillium fungicola]